MSKGFFLTIEGTEGVGKSTNLSFIADCIKRKGISLEITREPGGTPFAEEIRNLLLSPRDESVAPLSELLLMFAARAQHLQNKIIPALNAGTWVLSDRFTDATYAYQAGGRCLPVRDIEIQENLVQGELRPDLTFILDADPEIGMARAKKRGALDRFELERLEFFERVRAQYLERARKNPQRYAVIDASCSLNEVQEQIVGELKRYLD